MNNAYFGWVMLSRDALGKAEQMLSPDEQGVLDEVGILLVHKALADRFFPGTSVLHTRLRYALFIPWIIEDMYREKKRFPRPVETMEDREFNLTRLLKRTYESMEERDDADRSKSSGIIGHTIAYKPKQPASYAYWSALRTWGIVLPKAGTSRSAVMNELTREHIEIHDPQGDTDEEHPYLPLSSLPERPEGWMRKPITFELSGKERNWFRKQMSDIENPLYPGRKSLLSVMVANLKDLNLNKINSPWDTAVRKLVREQLGQEEVDALDFAERVAALSAICRAAYGALVENTCIRLDKVEITGGPWEKALNNAVMEHGALASRVTAEEISIYIKPPASVEAMLLKTVEWLKQGKADFSGLYGAYSACEMARKHNRSRLQTSPLAKENRAEWFSNANASKVRPVDYRWWNVKRLLIDLKTGQA